MLNVSLVALGGAIGAAARYGVSLAFGSRADAWPWATFAINVSGSFLIGLLAGWLSSRGAVGEPWRLFIGVGILGGFTTFSAYSLETLRLIERQDYTGAALYSLGSVIAGLIAVAIGFTIAPKVTP
ncbi:MAG: fluoride efflux transporter CrcB [Hyphomonadaceae bacterium]|nr:fluoride efflux transporter CrcB [Hyphomonadaceae bacterium]